MYVYIYYISVCVYLCIQIVQIFECISILHNFLKKYFLQNINFEKDYIKIIVIKQKKFLDYYYNFIDEHQ